MNPAQEYDGSDSSDEDFCPEKAANADDSEMGSDSEEVDSTEDDEDEEELNKQHTKQGKTSVKRCKKRNKKTANKGEDEKDGQTGTSRRSTRQVDTVSKNARLEKNELESDEDEQEKSHRDALWSDFLSDVKPHTPTKRTAKASSNSVADEKITDSNGIEKVDSKKDTEKENPKLLECNGKPDEITVTEIHDFAGEEVEVRKTIKAESIKENKQKQQSQRTGSVQAAPTTGLKRTVSGAGGGLGSLLSSIGKKKKLSVLEKSKMDWSGFKQDAGIEEELQTFNKGKDGYLERQDFLQRTDLRQFEIEKNMRQSRRKH